MKRGKGYEHAYYHQQGIWKRRAGAWTQTVGAAYDQEIITEISRRTDLAERYIEQVIEQKPIPAFPLHIGRSLYPLSNPIYEQRQAVMLEQNRIIREMAKRSSCVIVGRCGDHILEDVRPFRIFVYAELEHRIARCMERRTAEEVYSLEEMKQKVISVDKNRRKYYEYYTGKKWGDRLNYDLCVNTSRQEIKEIALALSSFISLG